jgi:hypothetical protein
MLGSGYTEKGETGEETSKEHAHYFFFISRDFFYKKMHLGKPNSQIRILL